MAFPLEKTLSNNDTENVHKSEDIYKHNKHSGGSVLKLFGLGDTFTNAIKKTKSSENKLINTYETMDKSVKRYHKSYDEHIKNLEKLDDYANFHGMENLFKNVIMKGSFKDGKVDKSSPILFRNYLIQSETTPSAFRKEHILRQVNYVLNKHFASSEHMFIKYMSVEIGKSEFILAITTIDNRKMTRKISHNKYIISMSETKAALKDILGTTKKNLKRKSKLIELDNYDSQVESTKKKSAKTKTKTKSGTRTRSRTKSGTEAKSGTKTKIRLVNNLSIFNKSNNTNNSDRKKNKMNTNTGNIDELPSGINIGNEVSKKSTKKSVLDIYLTPSQKAAKAATKAIPTAAQIGPSPYAATLPVGAPGTPGMLPPTTGIEQRKAEIIGTPGMTYQQTAPLPPPLTDQFGQHQQQANPDEARCNAIPNPGWDTCRPQNCRFDQRSFKCAALAPRNPFGGPGGRFGGPGSPFGALAQFGPPVQAPTPAAGFAPTPPIQI
jgi:hypothetical protein